MKSVNNPYAKVTVCVKHRIIAVRESLDTLTFPGYKDLCTKATTGTSTAAQSRRSEPGAV
jgi:hypothetical protein